MIRVPEGPPSRPPDFREVNVNVVVSDAAASTNYQVWLIALNIQDGVPIGCIGSLVGTLTTTASGAGQFSGSTTDFFSGDRFFQVVVSPGGFGTFPSFATNPYHSPCRSSFSRLSRRTG